MPSPIHLLPDDVEDNEHVGSSDEGSEQEFEFDPVGLSGEQLKFLGDYMTLEEQGECIEQLLDLSKCSKSGPFRAFIGYIATEAFFESMLSRVTARVEAAGTAVAPTVPQTEQEDDRGEEQEEDEDKGEEEHARPTEGAMSEAGTVPPQSETPTQP